MSPTKVIHPNWNIFKDDEIKKKLKDQISKLNALTLSPTVDKMFNAFSVDPKTIKCCIVGQDPYPSKRHATGYAFDVPEGTTRQSLFILQSIAKDYGIELTSLNSLKKDVMLLNANLTTEAGITLCHDWRWFTELVVTYIKKVNPTCQFVFLGRYAQSINVVDGFNMYHPIANARTGKKMLNEDFFRLTEEAINWKIKYKNAST